MRVTPVSPVDASNQSVKHLTVLVQFHSAVLHNANVFASWLRCVPKVNKRYVLIICSAGIFRIYKLKYTVFKQRESIYKLKRVTIFARDVYSKGLSTT